MAQIFLCHASEDKTRVREVYRRLQEEGLQPWLDEEDLLPGQDWTREIPRALKASEFILIFLSQNSVAKRGYVQREMKQALDALQEVPEGTIHTIPVRLDNCPVPEQFQRYHYANLFDPRGFDRLVQAIRVGLSQRQQPLAPRLTNSIGMEFVLIPAGTFIMGSPESDAEARDGEKPARQVTISQPFYLGTYEVTQQVTISQPFYLGTYEVTQRQWEAVMGTNPSEFTDDPNRPVEQVSWDDTQEFIHRLNAREGGPIYRLPTEAEWEYACRAGSRTAYSFGDDPSQLGAYGWYRDNSGHTTHPVGQRKPNAWGLYDMHGNVFEWVQDYFGEYAPELVTDPQGPTSGSDRVFRGGSFLHSAGGCRSAFRNYDTPDTRNLLLGFRLLREAR